MKKDRCTIHITALLWGIFSAPFRPSHEASDFLRRDPVLLSRSCPIKIDYWSFPMNVSFPSLLARVRDAQSVPHRGEVPMGRLGFDQLCQAICAPFRFSAGGAVSPQCNSGVSPKTNMNNMYRVRLGSSPSLCISFSCTSVGLPCNFYERTYMKHKQNLARRLT